MVDLMVTDPELDFTFVTHVPLEEMAECIGTLWSDDFFVYFDSIDGPEALEEFLNLEFPPPAPECKHIWLTGVQDHKPLKICYTCGEIMEPSFTDILRMI